MITGDDGVAGFFEDLPVLIIILAGVSILISSATFASERIAVRSAQSDLDMAAERLLDAMMTSLRDAHDGSILSSSICSLNISRCSDRTLMGASFAVCFIEYFPSLEWLRSASSSDSLHPESTGYASKLFNAVDSTGQVGIVEVMVHVWSNSTP